jgi:hypothetical protein
MQTILRSQCISMWTKGVPAQESHTGTQLVSPVTGCGKKMDASTTGPQTTKLSILEHIIVYTDSVGSGLAPKGTITHQNPSEITYLGNFLLLEQSTKASMQHIWGIFYLEAKYWIENMDSSHVSTVLCLVRYSATLGTQSVASTSPYVFCVCFL